MSRPHGGRLPEAEVRGGYRAGGWRAGGPQDLDDLVGPVGARGRPAGARQRVRRRRTSRSTSTRSPGRAIRTRCSRSSASRRTRFDIVIGDSQWIGRGATKGLYVELTELAADRRRPQEPPSARAQVPVRVPDGERTVVRRPGETDAMGWPTARTGSRIRRRRRRSRRSTGESWPCRRRGRSSGHRGVLPAARQKRYGYVLRHRAAATTTSRWASRTSCGPSAARGATRRR